MKDDDQAISGQQIRIDSRGPKKTTRRLEGVKREKGVLVDFRGIKSRGESFIQGFQWFLFG